MMRNARGKLGFCRRVASRALVGTGLLVAAAGTVHGAVPPPLPEEHLTVAKLPAPTPHWIWVFDDAINNEIDMRLHLYDGDTHRTLGQIDLGYWPMVALSPDGKTFAAATTYFSRGNKGTRTDVVEFTDTTSLETKHEVALPPKRIMSVQTFFSLSFSSDGHLLYVPYVTPAASFGVVDAQKNTLVGEIDTAGCVLAIPGGPNRVSSICENGKLLTVTLDATGHEVSRATSDTFFDVDKDPIFAQGVPSAGSVTFVSFDGMVHEVDPTGAKASFRTPWSLTDGAEKGVWRPGGVQIAAIHAQLGRLYVQMHKAGQEAHKDGGTEIWAFDTKTHKRVGRWPLGSPKLTPVIAVQVSQDPQPLLFAATATGQVAIYDALTGKLRHIEKQIGQTPWLMFNP